MNFRPNKHEYYRHFKNLLEACLKLARRNMQERSKGKPYGGKGKP